MKKLFSKIATAFRYHLVLNELRNRLFTLGLGIDLFYWTLEMPERVDPELYDYDLTGCTFDFVGPEDMLEIAANSKNRTRAMLLTRLAEGKKCFAQKYRGQITTFCWCDFHMCNHPAYPIRLGKDEAYLYDAYTLPSFRGRRFSLLHKLHGHDVSKRYGITKLYSITQATNTSAVRFAQHRGARFLWLGLHLSLFNRKHWRFVIKRYEK